MGQSQCCTTYSLHDIFLLHSNPQVLETGPGLKLENEDYNTRLQIFDSSWANSGVYTLKAENESGVDEATVEITVLGKLYLYKQ